MLRPFIPTLFLAAQFLFLSNPSSSQSSMPSSSCPCTLRGSVVDSVSDQPVPHALVKLTVPSPRAALTDSEGKFQFENLPAGSATVEAEKPGFLTQDPFARWYPTSPQIQLAPDSPPTLLKLIPEGVIFGQVSDENGEPLEGFTISLFLRGQGHRGLRLGSRMLQRAVITDDQGKFRIAGLRSGSYYLVARQPQTPAVNATGKSSAPSGYAAVFYPAATDIASAVPIKVPPGGTAQAKFSLKREPFIRLAGTISGYAPQERVFLTLQGPVGAPENFEVIFDNPTGSFHTQWIPPGVYNFTAQADGSTQDASGISSLASVRVDASSSHFDLHLALQTAANIPLVIHNPPGSSLENLQSLPLALALVPQGSGLPGFHQVLGTLPVDGQLFFPRVAPGTYELLTESPPGVSLYAESATWGSTDLFRHDLVLDSSASVSPIEVVIRDDGASLSGTISSSSGDPLPPAVVVLLTEKRKRARRVSAPGGRFEVSGLAPAVYRVFAIDSYANFDYEDAASLARISSEIQEITLAPKQSASINLELATVEE